MKIKTEIVLSVFSVLLIGDTFANPCGRIGCSCTDPKHIYCAGTSTISARAVAEAVVAGEVESADFRYRLFSSRFLGQIDVYFDSIETVRVEGGPCHYIIEWIGKTSYTIMHDCTLPVTVTTTEVAVITTQEEVVSSRDTHTSTSETTSVGFWHPVSTAVGSHTSTDIEPSRVTTAIAAIDQETSDQSYDITTDFSKSDISTEVELSEAAQSFVLPGEKNATPSPYESTGTALTLVERKSGEVHVSVSPDGSIDVILPYTLSLVVIVLIAIIVLCVCYCKHCRRRENDDTAVLSEDPENPLEDSNPGEGSSTLVKYMLGESESGDQNDGTVGESHELTSIISDQDKSVCVDPEPEAEDDYAETVDVGLQISIPESSPTPSESAQGEGLNGSLITEDGFDITEESYIDMSNTQDTRDYPTASSTVLSDRAYTPSLPGDISIISDGTEISGSMSAPTLFDDDSRISEDLDFLGAASAPDISLQPVVPAHPKKTRCPGRPRKGERAERPASWGLKKSYPTRGSKLQQPLEPGLPDNIRI